MNSDKDETELKPKILCEVDGDRCLGCAHYYGKADVCEHRDTRTDTRVSELEEAEREVGIYREFRKIAKRELGLVQLLDRLLSMEQPENPIWSEIEEALQQYPQFKFTNPKMRD